MKSVHLPKPHSAPPSCQAMARRWPLSRAARPKACARVRASIRFTGVAKPMTTPVKRRRTVGTLLSSLEDQRLPRQMTAMSAQPAADKAPDGRRERSSTPSRATCCFRWVAERCPLSRSSPSYTGQFLCRCLLQNTTVVIRSDFANSNSGYVDHLTRHLLTSRGGARILGHPAGSSPLRPSREISESSHAASQ